MALPVKSNKSGIHGIQARRNNDVKENRIKRAREGQRRKSLWKEPELKLSQPNVRSSADGEPMNDDFRS